MDTPEIFYENLSKGIITYEMLDLALFSLNKRAKNYRDQKRKAKKSLYAQAQLFGFSNPDNPEEAERMEKEFYAKKERLLQIVKPVCVHQELAGYKKDYIYDKDEIDYADIFIDSIFHNRVLDRGICRKEGKDIRFFVRKGEPYYRYYFFRCIGTHTYHSPINKETALSSGLPIHIINEIKTEGERNENLIPEDSVDQMLALVDSETYTYVPSNTIRSPRESILPPVTYVIPQKYEWEEVLDLLKEKYPEKPGLLKVDLSIRLWRKIMKLRAFSAESCMRCIWEERRRR